MHFAAQQQCILHDEGCVSTVCQEFLATVTPLIIRVIFVLAEMGAFEKFYLRST